MPNLTAQCFSRKASHYPSGAVSRFQFETSTLVLHCVLEKICAPKFWFSCWQTYLSMLCQSIKRLFCHEIDPKKREWEKNPHTFWRGRTEVEELFHKVLLSTSLSRVPASSFNVLFSACQIYNQCQLSQFLFHIVLSFMQDNCGNLVTLLNSGFRIWSGVNFRPFWCVLWVFAEDARQREGGAGAGAKPHGIRPHLISLK